jgi:hypothetical protein
MHNQILYGVDFFSYPRDGAKAYKFKFFREYAETAIYYCNNECIAHQVVIKLNQEYDYIGVPNPWKFIGVSNT